MRALKEFWQRPKSLNVCNCPQVSAGYDAHWRDPLACLQMRSSTYYRLAAKIKGLADSLSGKLSAFHGWLSTIRLMDH